MRLGFPGGSSVKNPLASAGEMDSFPGSGGSSAEGKGSPLQSWEIPQRSLVYHSVWGRKRVRCDLMTKQQLYKVKVYNIMISLVHKEVIITMR